MRLATTAILLVLSATDVHSQTGLTVDRVFKIASQAESAYTVPIRCGFDESVYLQFGGPISGPVVRISPDGKRITQFLLKSGSATAENLELTDYAPATNGGAYLLADSQPKSDSPVLQFLLRFDSDGQLQSESKIESRFPLRHIAALGADKLLALGLDRSTMTPIAAVFGDDGRFVKALGLSEDMTFKDFKCERCEGQQDYAKNAFANQVARSRAASFDGGAYLYRASSEGPVFIVSEGGAVRRVKLTPPRNGKLLDVKVASSGIWAVYNVGESSENLIEEIVSMDSSGKKLGEFRALQSSTLACHSRDQSSFLRRTDSELQLVYAVAQY